MKLAMHFAGYVNPIASLLHPGVTVSTPRTVVSHPDDGTRIPKEAVKELRMYLTRWYPALANKELMQTRLCW